ncbi:hypothetical protein DVH05_027444 [Phytophthora capsici]|nr:hypothetical protein DVH05_027444 [Phytophthora capsici]
MPLTWPVQEINQEQKIDAFNSNAQRVREISNLSRTINILKCDVKANADDIVSTSELLKEIRAKDKLMLRRTRKYRLFPTEAQRRKLLQFMGVCRWTYNQAVAHFRETNVSKAASLRDLYVTKTSAKKLVYPEGMGPPPVWAFKTPKSFRFNALRKFETNVKSAFSNPSNGNIDKFKVWFKSRKRDGRYFTRQFNTGEASDPYYPSLG